MREYVRIIYPCGGLCGDAEPSKNRLSNEGKPPGEKPQILEKWQGLYYKLRERNRGKPLFVLMMDHLTPTDTST
ncbi:MAG: hypothetical protein ABDH29_07160 [Aquificaceae bacterium]